MLHYLTNSYYSGHPESIVLDMGPLDFSWDYIANSLPYIKHYVGVFSPCLPSNAVVVVFVLFIIAFASLKRYKLVVSVLSGLLFIVLSLGFSKVHTGSDSVFYPVARMYLAVPLVMASCFLWLEQALMAKQVSEPARSSAVTDNAKIAKATRLVYGLTLLLFGFFVYKFSITEEVINKELGVESVAEVVGVPTSLVYDSCRSLEEMAQKYGAELVVFNREDEILAYACEPLSQGKIKTLLLRDAVAERRSWRIEEETRAKRDTLLFYNLSAEQVERGMSSGLRFGPAYSINGMAVFPVTMTVGAERNIFLLFETMTLDGALDLLERATSLRARRGGP